MTEQEARILGKVLEMLGSGSPTTQNLDDYIVAYQILGNLVAHAQGESETAEMVTKLAWAEEFAKAKEEKISDMVAKAKADVAVHSLRMAEVKAHEKWAKLKATRESVWEAVNAIKFLGRNGG